MSLTKEQAKQDKAWNRAITKAEKESKEKHEIFLKRMKSKEKNKNNKKK